MEHVDRYLDWMASKGSPATTVKTYRNRLKRYRQAVDPLTVSSLEFELWHREYVRDKKPATVSSYLGTVRSYHAWLRDVAHLRVDSPIEVASPSVPIDTPAPPPLADILRFLERMDELNATAAAVIGLMFGGALRVTEALSLRVADVDVANRIATPTGKGGDRVPVPFPVGTQARLARYLEIRANDSPYLFPAELEGKSQTGHLSYTWLLQRIDECATSLGWDPEPWGRTHLFRHACATELMRRDVHLRKIQRQLRHKDVKQTQRYLHAVLEDLARAIDRHHPLSAIARAGATLAGVPTRPMRVQLVAWAT